MRSDHCQPVILTELLDQRTTLMDRAQQVARLQGEVASRDAQVAQVQKHAIWQQKCADIKHWEVRLPMPLQCYSTRADGRGHGSDWGVTALL